MNKTITLYNSYYTLEQLITLLNFNTPSHGTSSSSSIEWKVLIYDAYGKQIISPLFNTKTLRSLGVTLYMDLHSVREALPDVSCLYFMLPSPENLKRVSQDTCDHLYSSCHLNFITPISRMALENVANEMLKNGNNTACISKIYDHHLSYIALESNFFMLRKSQQSYVMYNKKNDESEEEVERITEGLFAVLVSMKTVPVIRCPAEGPSQRVAELLEKKVKEHLVRGVYLFFNMPGIF